jgi:hypothetical protein
MEATAPAATPPVSLLSTARSLAGWLRLSCLAAVRLLRLTAPPPPPPQRPAIDCHDPEIDYHVPVIDYRSTRSEASQFQRCDAGMKGASLAIGGGGTFGLWLDGGLASGTSGHCLVRGGGGAGEEG